MGKPLTQQEQAALLEKVAKLEGTIENMRKAGNRPIAFKVSQKGALSMYGMGRWPVTLYKSQWLRVIEAIPHLRKAIDEFGDQLLEKGEKSDAKA